MVPKLLETVRKQIAVPRLVIVASDVHYWTTMEMDVIAPPSILEVVKRRLLHKRVGFGFFLHCSIFIDQKAEL